MELGGNIQLTGFEDVDRTEMVIIKKVVGNYAKKFYETIDNFQELSVTIKKDHKTSGSEKYKFLPENVFTYNSF